MTLEVDVRLAADVDHDAVELPARERVRRLARIVVGDRVPGVAAHVQPRAGHCEGTELRLDLSLADLVAP